MLQFGNCVALSVFFEDEAQFSVRAILVALLQDDGLRALLLELVELICWSAYDQVFFKLPSTFFTIELPFYATDSEFCDQIHVLLNSPFLFN